MNLLPCTFGLQGLKADLEVDGDISDDDSDGGNGHNYAVHHTLGTVALDME